MMMRKQVFFTLGALVLMSVLLPGCGGKSNDDVPAAAKNGALKNREGGDAGTTGDAGTSGTTTTPDATATPNASGTIPAAPENATNPQSHHDK